MWFLEQAAPLPLLGDEKALLAFWWGEWASRNASDVAGE